MRSPNKLLWMATLGLVIGNSAYGFEFFRPRSIAELPEGTERQKLVQLDPAECLAGLGDVNLEAFKQTYPVLRFRSEDDIRRLIAHNFCVMTEAEMQLVGIRITQPKLAPPPPPGQRRRRTRYLYRTPGHRRTGFIEIRDFDGTFIGLAEIRAGGISADDPELAKQVREFRNARRQGNQARIDRLRTRPKSDGVATYGEALVDYVQSSATHLLYAIHNELNGTQFEEVAALFEMRLPGFVIKESNRADDPLGMTAHQPSLGRLYDETLREDPVYPGKRPRNQVWATTSFGTSINFNARVISGQPLLPEFGDTPNGRTNEPQDSFQWGAAHDAARQSLRNPKATREFKQNVLELLQAKWSEVVGIKGYRIPPVFLPELERMIDLEILLDLYLPDPSALTTRANWFESMETFLASARNSNQGVDTRSLRIRQRFAAYLLNRMPQDLLALLMRRMEVAPFAVEGLEDLMTQPEVILSVKHRSTITQNLATIHKKRLIHLQLALSSRLADEAVRSEGDERREILRQMILAAPENPTMRQEYLHLCRFGPFGLQEMALEMLPARWFATDREEIQTILLAALRSYSLPAMSGAIAFIQMNPGWFGNGESERNAVGLAAAEVMERSPRGARGPAQLRAMQTLLDPRFACPTGVHQLAEILANPYSEVTAQTRIEIIRGFYTLPMDYARYFWSALSEYAQYSLIPEVRDTARRILARGSVISISVSIGGQCAGQFQTTFPVRPREIIDIQIRVGQVRIDRR